MLILQRPWTRQPQGPVKLNPLHPLARSIAGFSVGAYAGAPGVSGLCGYASSVNYDSYGASANILFTKYFPELDVATPWSMFSICNGTRINAGASTYQQILNVSAYVSTTDNFETGLSFWNLTSNLCTQFRSNNALPGTTGTVVFPSGLATVYTKHDWNGNNASARLNFGGTILSGPAYGTRVPRDTRRAFTAHSYLTVFVTKALSEDEQVLLFRSPWSLFAPRRIYIPTAAAAATAPNITALSARLITATSAQPRISYS